MRHFATVSHTVFTRVFRN